MDYSRWLAEHLESLSKRRTSSGKKRLEKALERNKRRKFDAQEVQEVVM
jgi:hypothetical protein